jgi:hypothetical protein
MVSAIPASDKGNAIANEVVRALMQRAGLAYSLSNEPNQRALTSFQAGLYDVDVLRVAQFDLVFPGAIRIEPHLLSTTLHAISTSPEVRPRNWEELKAYRIAHVRGAKSIELQLLPGQRAELTSTAASCMAMAAAGRVDLCLVNAEAQFMPPQSIEGRALHHRIFDRVRLHMWAAPGREALAQELSQAIKAMVASGELARLAGPNRAP